ncbi:MAG: transcriptional regulator [Chloroflexi bacterium]|nr:MAG: transcriptional regulator [Chloroflexota bacterium]
MQKQLVITLTGEDRVGIVDDVTKIILANSGNVESSRMARLGGLFAMLMLVAVAEEQLAGLQAALDSLRSQGFELSTRFTVRGVSKKFEGWHNFQIDVRGADHEGIIHDITHHLAQQGVSVESIDTGTEDAPFGAMKLFVMSATVFAPPSLSLPVLQEELEEVGKQLNVDVNIQPIKH